MISVYNWQHLKASQIYAEFDRLLSAWSFSTYSLFYSLFIKCLMTDLSMV